MPSIPGVNHLDAVRALPHRLADEAALRRAVLTLEARLDAEDPAPYAAWLSAWEHHWPTRFDAVFGEAGRALSERLRAKVTDDNRYLELRRIAIDNLAAIV